MRKILSRVFRKVPPPSPNGIPCALIGLGGYAEKVIIPTLLKTKQYNLLGICSNSQERISSLQRMFRIPEGSTALNDFLKKDTIKLIFITQKDSLHADTIEKVAEAKKHIFVEKPIALTPKECKKVEKAIKKHKVHITVGLNRRFSRLGNVLKEKLRTRTTPVNIIYKFNLEKEVTKEKEWMLTESGPVRHTFGHFIDFSSWLLNATPIKVKAKSLSPQNQKVHREVTATVTFSEGSTLTIILGITDNQQEREIMEISDSGKTIVLKNFKELCFHGYPDQDIILRHADKGQYEQLRSFAQYLRGSLPATHVTMQDGINATLFCHAVLESISKKKTISLSWKKQF